MVSRLSNETAGEIDVINIFAVIFWQHACAVEIGKLRNFGRLPIDFPVAQGFNQRMGTFLERGWTSALKLSRSYREASRRYLRPLSWLFKHIRKLRAVGPGKASLGIDPWRPIAISAELVIVDGRGAR